MYRVLLLDTDGSSPEVIHECERRSEAEALCVEWDKEPLGYVAVVWPGWAALPEGTILPSNAEVVANV